jgi:hypothetical protein
MRFEEMVTQTPLWIAFTVLDRVMRKEGGQAALTKRFVERLAIYLTNLEAPPTIQPQGEAIVLATATEAMIPGLTIRLALFERPRAKGRGQWQVHSLISPPLTMLAPQKQWDAIAIHGLITMQIVNWPETEDVDASGEASVMGPLKHIYGPPNETPH